MTPEAPQKTAETLDLDRLFPLLFFFIYAAAGFAVFFGKMGRVAEPSSASSPRRRTRSTAAAAEDEAAETVAAAAAHKTEGSAALFSLDHKLNDFYWVHDEEPHRSRRVEMLKAHPELRNLMRHEPLTKWIVTTEVIVQFALAWWLATTGRDWRTWEFWVLACESFLGQCPGCNLPWTTFFLWISIFIIFSMDRLCRRNLDGVACALDP